MLTLFLKKNFLSISRDKRTNYEKIILAILGVLTILAAVLFVNRLVEENERPKPIFIKQIKIGFVNNVLNKETPIILFASGSLVAKKKIDLFSEV
ncbi:MAG: membrane fusion protein (multidrug efflux system) [Polaribacter sp.]|jgi:membrane fusion protein (multidrug efflux system)